MVAPPYGADSADEFQGCDVNVIMFLRDPLPPHRVDVRVLFDEQLRRHGISTDFVGHIGGESAGGASAHRFEGALIAFDKRPWPAFLAGVGAVIHDLRVLLSARRRCDLVVVRDKPIEGSLLFLVARIQRRKCVYWMSFPIPLGHRTSGFDQMRRGRWLRGAAVAAKGLVAGLVQRWLTLPLADLIFVQSDEMKRLVASSGIAAEKLTPVPMGVDRKMIDSLDRLQIESSALGEPWVVYIGTLERARRLDVLIRAMALVVKEVPQARLALIGQASLDDRQMLADVVRSFQLEASVEIRQPMAMADALRVVKSAAVGVSPIPPGPLFDPSSPTKTLEYLAVGVPAVVSPIPDQRKVVEESGGGLCAAFSPEGIAAALISLLSRPEDGRAMGQKGRAYVLRYRTYEAIAPAVASGLLGIANC